MIPHPVDTTSSAPGTVANATARDILTAVMKVIFRDIIETMTALEDAAIAPDLQIIHDSLLQNETWQAENPRLILELESMVLADERMIEDTQFPVEGKFEVKSDKLAMPTTLAITI